jgi:hypothetical protein
MRSNDPPHIFLHTKPLLVKSLGDKACHDAPTDCFDMTNLWAPEAGSHARFLTGSLRILHQFHFLFVCQTWGRCTQLSGPDHSTCPHLSGTHMYGNSHPSYGVPLVPTHAHVCNLYVPLRVDCCWTSELGTTYSAAPTCYFFRVQESDEPSPNYISKRLS